MKPRFKVLMVTSGYPSPERPHAVPFIVRQIEELRREGVDVDVFAFNGRQRLSNYIRAWLRLRKHTSGKSYDLMHAQWGHSAILAFPKRMPWVITFRGNDLEGIVGPNGRYTLKGKILKVVSRLAARYADGKIAVSRALADHLSSEDVEVIPSGLDLEVFRPMDKRECREQLGLPQDKKLVLFAASTVHNPRKRLELAREAVELLKRETDAELVIATKVTHAEIAMYMSACDALVLTSMHEGSPNVVKEAIACDLPVVSVDVGDTRERIALAGAGAICGDTPAELAAGLGRVLAAGPVTTRESILELDERRTTRRVIGMYHRVVQQQKASAKMRDLGGEDNYSIRRA